MPWFDRVIDFGGCVAEQNVEHEGRRFEYAAYFMNGESIEKFYERYEFEITECKIARNGESLVMFFSPA